MMKDATVTHRLNPSLLGRVDKLVEFIDPGDVGGKSRSAMLRKGLEIGVTELERRAYGAEPSDAALLAQLGAIKVELAEAIGMIRRLCALTGDESEAEQTAAWIDAEGLAALHGDEE